jgi:hypothetical protein
MPEGEGVRPATDDDELSDAEEWRQMVFGFQETLLGVLGTVQPLVVLFSLSVVVATFTRQAFPESSDWSLVATFGFGWALVFSATIKFVKSRERRRWLTIAHLYSYLGVLVGFLSLGMALLFMSAGNDLIIRAGLLMGSEALAIGTLPWAFRTRSWVDIEQKLARQRGESSLVWSILGKTNTVGMLLATLAPPFLFFRTVGGIFGWVGVVYAIGFGIMVSVRVLTRLLSRR